MTKQQAQEIVSKMTPEEIKKTLSHPEPMLRAAASWMHYKR